MNVVYFYFIKITPSGIFIALFKIVELRRIIILTRDYIFQTCIFCETQCQDCQDKQCEKCREMICRLKSVDRNNIAE